ncbi:uncharacterized protein [Lolium perenne]|uniref:uncharacterized protein n=1 Tax=Lolium perenne TaxID=4522 RepID=UPI003A995B23
MEAPTEQPPPRGTKRPPGDGDIYKASGARRYGVGSAYDDEERGGGGGSGSRDDTGFLDENGTFVERAARGATKEEAWLGPADADAAPAATKRARKALRRQEEDERLVDDLVASRAVFDIRKRVVGILEPGETVPRALRRLKGLGGAAGTRGTAGSRMDEATRRAFDELTDAAAELFDRGDLDAYSHDREAFEEAAWAYEYGRRARAAASAAAQEVEEGYQAAATTRDYVDAGAETAGGQAVDPDQPDTPGDASGTAASEAGEGAGVGGWDYVYDPASGYYYSSITGYFYDAASGCYCSAYTGTWFSYGDDGQCYGTVKEME